jgi:hypothetical protein
MVVRLLRYVYIETGDRHSEVHDNEPNRICILRN